MLTYKITQTSSTPAKGTVFFVRQTISSPENQSFFDDIARTYPAIFTLIKDYNFEGKRGQIVTIPLIKETSCSYLILVGIGSLAQSWNQELDHARRAIARALPVIKQLKLEDVTITIPPTLITATEQSAETLAFHLMVAALMASYEFNDFKTEIDEPELTTSLLWNIPGANRQELEASLHRALIIGTSINRARQWADTPPNIMTPAALAEEASKIAARYPQLTCTIFGKERAQELGMGAFLAVDQGTHLDGKFVILEYKTATPNAPTIALCGKGITFDTGGISLKPSNSMEGMKFDMSGAAATIATLEIMAQLQPTCNVIGITPLTENMPSGTACRQDDIVRAMNGVSIEIKNTDAEGRLILADALCYAEKMYEPDIIIDIATLTGACAYALGHFYTAIMTKDHDMAQQFINIGALTGDRIWELPLDDDFMDGNKSDVADVNNSGSRAYLAGTIIGACFLSKFVQKARWAHLDIAGTAHDVTGINYVGKGATGAGIRALVEFILQTASSSTARKDHAA